MLHPVSLIATLRRQTGTTRVIWIINVCTTSQASSCWMCGSRNGLFMHQRRRLSDFVLFRYKIVHAVSKSLKNGIKNKFK